MANRLFSGRQARHALIGALILVAAIAIVWPLFGPWLRVSSVTDDVGRLISERWAQIYYDRSSPEIASDGNVTIVAFLDYDSEDCRKVAAALSRLHETDLGVRIVFKALGAPGSIANISARALLAADRQDRFLLLHKELIQGRPQVTESSVIAAAQTAGLDIARLRADMTDSAIGKAIEENQSLAHVLGVSSPALLIGNRIYHGATDLKALQAAVAQARSQASQ